MTTPDAAETAAGIIGGPLTWDTIAMIAGTLLAALIAAWVAVRGYAGQQRAARAEGRAAMYAHAMQAVADYLEGPYRVRRRDGTAEGRRQVTQAISDIQSRIDFHVAWLAIHAPADVAQAYREYVTKARREAGPQMTQAWHTRPSKRDQDVPLGEAYDRTASQAAQEVVLHAMRRDLDG